MQFSQKFSQPPADDTFYTRTRSMLSSLGLQKYEKNFKKGLLTDSTLPLLTDRLEFYTFYVFIINDHLKNMLLDLNSNSNSFLCLLLTVHSEMLRFLLDLDCLFLIHIHRYQMPISFFYMLHASCRLPFPVWEYAGMMSFGR